MEGCEGCKMRELFPKNTFVQIKHGSGDRLVIAEAPGETESHLGEPLVGGSGQFFDSLCSKAGVRRGELTLLNTIQCRPPDNIYPLSSEARSYISKSDAEAAVEHCYRRYVKPVIQGVNWKRIDLLGERALSAVTGRNGIYKFRGSVLSSRERPEVFNVVATIHPAGLMREQTFIPVVISDLRKSLVQPPERYSLYPGVQELEAFVNATREFCFDIETNRFTGEIYMVGLAARPFECMVVPFKGPYIKLLQRLFAGAGAVIGQNIIQFDLEVLEKNGVILNPQAQVWDIMLMHHLVSPDLPHDLEFISSIYCNKPAWKHLEKENKELYCARDTDCTIQIFPQLRALLRQLGLLDVYNLVSVPMGKVSLLLRKLGVKIDASRIGEVRDRLLRASEELERGLPESLRTHDEPCNRRIPAPPGSLGKSGKPVKFLTVPSSERITPWRSDKFVGKWLYEELKLPVQYHIKTKKQTTDKTALDKLYRLAANPAILAVRKLRQIDETLTTFAKEKMVFGTSIHTSFNVHGTSSGRLSSSDPNLQNIPEDTRCIYIPHYAGWKLLQFDYSQIENRITAFLAHDTERLGRLNDSSFSEHKWAASQFFGIPYEEVVKDNDKEAPYGKAKRIVHGSNYGMGARKIANLYDMQEVEVKKLLAAWKGAILKTSQWQEAVAAEAKREGFLVNAFGRKRWFYTSSYYTEALSFLPQSTAADILLRAMVVLLHERINWPLSQVQKLAQLVKPLPKPANLLLTVHDSLVFECPPALVDEVVSVVKAVMQQSWPELGGFSCPVSCEIGDSWGEMEKYVA